MTHNYNEGHPNAAISQIEGYAKDSLSEQPNVVLLMAGTIDITSPVDPSTAPERLGELIDDVVTACPTAVVLVAELPPISDTEAQARAVAFNAAIPDIVAARTSAGLHVLTVNMSNYVTVADLGDGVHPSDRGYSLVAQAWYDGLETAASKGWIVKPENVNRMMRKRVAAAAAASTSCSKISTVSQDNKLVASSTAAGVSTDSTTTLYSTSTTTSTVTVYRSTTSTSSSSTPPPPPPPSTTAPPTLASTGTSIPFPSNTTTTVLSSLFPTAPSSTPISISLQSSSASAAVLPSSPTSAPFSPPPTSGASVFKVDLSCVVFGLAFFWMYALGI